MTDVVLRRQRIEPGKEKRLCEWTDEILEREDEALETLEHEGMCAEAAFIERTDDETFLVYYMEAEDMDHVFEAFANSDHEIDAEHERVMDDVLEDGDGGSDFELLYHLRNSNHV